ncbi:hypothetical protein V7S43_006515 [Phytophthora oleae]|uniref:Uncharacterized protein n=1 Tax=Phytophthora oleae TaxID=2107226 RepID=A0ABD3FPU3_9STRA
MQYNIDDNNHVAVANDNEIAANAAAPSDELRTTNVSLLLTLWLDPNDVLNSLLIMENYWRTTDMEIPSEVLDLLVRTRESLQRQNKAATCTTK